MKTAHSLRRLFCLLLLLTIVYGSTAHSLQSQAQSSVRFTIDFTTLVTVPLEFRAAIEHALNQEKALLPPTDRFTISALRHAGDWMHAVLVPTSIVDAQWEAELKPAAIVEILARRSEPGNWSAHLRGSPEFKRLARDVPQTFDDLTALPDLSGAPAQAVTFLFPWTKDQGWYKTQGWHQGNSLDFQPVARANPPVDFAVLAAAQGRMSVICGGPGTNDPYETTLKIDHPDGTASYYGHLDANTVRYDLNGQVVITGQFLGLLYNGTQGGGGGYQFRTPCGAGTAFHLHVTLPSQTMTINGYNANDVANSPFATVYVSSNPRTDQTTPVGGILVKDQDDPNVERGGTANLLFDAPAGSVVSNGHATWTGSNANSPDNYIKWKPPLDHCGNWEVFAYVPYVNNNMADTTNAVYKIRHRSGTTPAGVEESHVVNMEAVNNGFGTTKTDRWISLGTYLWSTGANNVGEYVLLGDSTGESEIRSVDFDDLRWEFRGADTTACNLPPNIPTLIAPTNGGKTFSRSVTLIWQDTGDPDNGPRNYRDYTVEIWRSGDSWRDSMPWKQVTSWNITLPGEGTYYWHVQSGDGTVGSGWSGNWSISVVRRYIYIPITHR